MSSKLSKKKKEEEMVKKSELSESSDSLSSLVHDTESADGYIASQTSTASQASSSSASPSPATGGKNKIPMQNFDKMKAYTKTFTATTNLVLNLDALYEILPITDFIVIPKKRGRKSKTENVCVNQDIEEGSIITVKKSNEEYRGVIVKQPPKPKVSSTETEIVSKKNRNYFRNSITVVMILEKHINFKISQNGTFQFTGCKSHKHVEKCIDYIWSYIKDSEEVYSFSSGSSLKILYIPCMRNIDFSLGFIIDRNKLTNYFKHHSEFPCMLENLFGYTGVNIKIEMTDDIRQMEIRKKEWIDNKWDYSKTQYQEYLDLLKPKDRNYKIDKKRYNTFLIFQSGECVMSGLKKKYMRDVYYHFIGIINKARNQIEEKLTV